MGILLIDNFVRFESLVRQQLVQFFGAVKGLLSTFALLVHFVHDEAGQEGVDGQAIDGDEQSGDRESDDEDNLSKMKSTPSK